MATIRTTFADHGPDQPHKEVGDRLREIPTVHTLKGPKREKAKDQLHSDLTTRKEKANLRITIVRPNREKVRTQPKATKARDAGGNGTDMLPRQLQIPNYQIRQRYKRANNPWKNGNQKMKPTRPNPPGTTIYSDHSMNTTGEIHNHYGVRTTTEGNVTATVDYHIYRRKRHENYKNVENT